jgi:hypothetical protein
VFQQGIIFFYLSVTVAAFIYTMTRIAVVFPKPLIMIAYGMMAPYQADSEWNTDFIAEGYRDGAWQRIDLGRYYPFGFGETNVRKHLITFHWRDPESEQRARASMALQILAHERARGNSYASLRIIREEWPRSAEGFDALRKKPFINAQILIEVQ